MPGAVVKDITPDWLKTLRPQNASVLDPTWLKAARTLAQLSGLTDPNTPVMGMMAPMEAGGNAAANGLSAVLEKWASRGVKLEAYETPNGAINVAKIIVPAAERNKGIGTEAMRDIASYADETGKTVTLSPSTSFGASSITRLKDFYKRLGYVENKGRARDLTLSESMYRLPAEGYRGTHLAPTPESGAPLHDLTGGGRIYPDDVYSPRAAQYYGHFGGGDPIDERSFRIAHELRDKPDADVWIYRAVPNDSKIATINTGDWVTINPEYAADHGERQFGDYKVLRKMVKAKDIYTNGDSIHEWGYHPSESK